jgi:hypothetical protein
MLDRPIDGLLVSCLNVQLVGLVLDTDQSLLKFVPTTLEFIKAEHVRKIGIRQPFSLIHEMRFGRVQAFAARVPHATLLGTTLPSQA